MREIRRGRTGDPRFSAQTRVTLLSEIDAARLKARLAIVEEHVKCENRHDLAGLMATFDAEDRLAGERIYYDRGTVMRQLGLFHEPEGALGRLATGLSHPLTIARAFLRSSP
jgi:hypothetical protein